MCCKRKHMTFYHNSSDSFEAFKKVSNFNTTIFNSIQIRTICLKNLEKKSLLFKDQWNNAYGTILDENRRIWCVIKIFTFIQKRGNRTKHNFSFNNSPIPARIENVLLVTFDLSGKNETKKLQCHFWKSGE